MIEATKESSVRTDTGDIALQVRVAGEGPPMVLVGGGLTGWSSWAAHIERLVGTRTVAAVQLMNVQYGLEGRDLPAEYDVPMESAALARALDSLGWDDPIDIAAWSYGALVSLDYALGHPERIRTLTLIEPPALWVLDAMGEGDPDVEAVRSLRIRGQVSEADLEEFLRSVGLAPPDTDLRTLPQWDVWMKHRHSLRAITVPMNFDGGDRARLAAFDRPVLLVTGTGTAPFHRLIHETLADRLPRAVAIEMPGGHAPHIVTMDRFLAELHDFQAAQYATSKDGTTIGFVRRDSGEAGPGQAILFVHGTTADRNSWSRVTPYLESHLAVYVMDRRGRGLSGDAEAYDLAREAEDVAAVVEAIGKPVILFGHSYGGLSALEAARLTGHLKRLILYEPAVPNGEPTYAKNDLQTIEEWLDAGELEAAMNHFLKKIALISKDELDAYRQSPLWQPRIPLARTIPREFRIEDTYVFDPSRFSGVKIPTTLLLGSDSPRFYRDAVETLRAAIPQSEIVTLEGQQHVAHHAAPELLARVILASLDN